MKIKTLLFSFILVSFSTIAQDRKSILDSNVYEYNAKINEVVANMLKNGFEIYKEQKLGMLTGYDFELNIPLKSGLFYNIVFVGDPSSRKILVSLAKEDIGYMFVDRIKKNRDHEFWTNFEFPCQQSGNYLFTAMQKNTIEYPLGYLMVFKKVK